MGWAALIIFVLSSVGYSLLKRRKIKLGKINILNFHGYLAILGTIIVFIHAYKSIFYPGFTPGKGAFAALILTDVLGIIIKYSKRLKRKTRNIIRYIHIIFALIFVLFIIGHLIYYVFLN